MLSQWLVGDEVGVVENFQKEYGYNQQLGIYEKDYIEGSGQSYEGVVFTDGGREVIYYNQLDERWADTMYGTSGTIGEAGCGPYGDGDCHIYPDRDAPRPGGTQRMGRSQWAPLRRERFLSQPDPSRRRSLRSVLGERSPG